MMQAFHDLAILAQSGVVERRHDEKEPGAMFGYPTDALECLDHLADSDESEIVHRDRHDEFLGVTQPARSQQAG